jgi:hypothetical protein
MTGSTGKQQVATLTLQEGNPVMLMKRRLNDPQRPETVEIRAGTIGSSPDSAGVNS